MDGNNLLKRMGPLGTRRVADKRKFEDSDYYLKDAEVEAYAQEVKKRKGKGPGKGKGKGKDAPAASQQAEPAVSQLTNDSSASPGELKDRETDEGDPVDTDGLDPSIAACAENWKAAKSDDMKKEWGIYEETRIFASTCRHGLFLWLIDMYRSGEL